MAKLTRVSAKVFADSAAADEIGQFGSAVTGAKLETADVATIQGLSAWLSGWSEALVSGNRYPALQEMNGLLKVLSYQGAYTLQEGIAEYDSATTYYIGSIVKKTGTFELYGSLTDNNIGNALTVNTEWKFLIDLSSLTSQFTADTSNMPILSNNITDINNDIDFSAGFCYDLTTNAKITNTALTKRLDATFIAGTNQGGLDTGSKAVSIWYHCFAISKADGTADFLFSTSATSPTMPNGFIYKRRIGSIKTNSDGNILEFYQNKNTFLYKLPIVDVAVRNLGTTAIEYVISTPTSIVTEAILQGYINSNTVGSMVYLSSLNTTDLIPNNVVSPLATINVTSSTIPISFSNLRIFTNIESKIRTRGSVELMILEIVTQGWIDNRGIN